MDRQDSLNEILDDVNDDVSNSKQYRGITKTHWQPNNYNAKCATSECGKAFHPIRERIHHCRRCGGLFCKLCVRYQRRLNNLARPDPNGRLHKVCKQCHDQGPQSMGANRSWSNIFRATRDIEREKPASLSSTDGVSTASQRDRLELDKECSRILEGFQQSVGKSEVKRAMVDMASMLSVPEWQKSSLIAYGNLTSKCNACQRDFGLRRQKHNCTVCGVAVCTSKGCSSKDLLVYILDKPRRPSKEEKKEENGDTTDAQQSDNAEELASREPQLAIIKIVGSPSKEPNLSLYLRICRHCQQSLEDLQVHRYQRDLKHADPQTDAWTTMIQQCDRFRTLEGKIESLLPQYQDLVDYIDVGVAPPPSPGGGRKKGNSNTQTLAKAQSDLGDHLTQFPMMIHSLKQIKPVTKAQVFIFKNIIQSKCQFYHENIFLFRESKKRLADSTPPDVLGAIQGIVDQNAVNSGYLSMKQLALEVLHLSTKYQLGEEVPMRLSQTESVMYEDLKHEICKKPDENWQVHEACLNELIQCQLKERRLIKPSKRLLRKLGAAHVREVVRERCVYVTRQVHLQLEEKSAAKQFTHSKEELRGLLEYFGIPAIEDTGN